MRANTQFAREAEKLARQYKKIQDQIREADKKNPPQKTRRAMQAGARKYPAPPMARQHLAKPGKQKDLEEQPMCDAPFYRGSGKLEGKVAIITGADSGIGRAVAVLFAREGADISVLYLNEHEDAEETKRM